LENNSSWPTLFTSTKDFSVGGSIIGFDFNTWLPHVKTTMEVLSVFARKGEKASYLPIKYSAYPNYFNPFFGDSGVLREESLNRNSIELLSEAEFGDATPIFQPEVIDDLIWKVQNAQSTKDLASISYESHDVGYAILSTMLSATKSATLDTRTIRKYAPKLLNKYIKSAELTNKVICSKSPGTILIFNGRHVQERAVWRVARANSIRVLFHESPGTGNLYFLSENQMHAIEGHARQIADAAKQFSLEEIQILGRGWFEKRLNLQDESILSFQRKWKTSSPSVTEKQKLQPRISFFPTSDDEYLGLSGEWDLPGMLDQSEWLSMVMRIAIELNFDVHLRLHPNFENKGRRLRKSWERIGKNVGVTLHGQSSPVNTYDLIRTSDLVITCGSTVALEAVYLGRPVLSIGSALYDNIGAIYKSQDLPTIKEILASRNFISLHGNLDRALEFGFYEIYKKREFRTEATTNLQSAFLCEPSIINRAISKIIRSINLL